MMAPDFAQNLDRKVARLTAGLQTKSRDFTWRKTQLQALRKMLIDNDQRLNEVLWKDYRKSPFECATTEQGLVVGEIDFALAHLENWMSPERVSTPLFNQIGSSEIVREPYGLTLIIGAWNYPVQLLLSPLVGALCGGNAVILKPSEISAGTGRLLTELIEKYLDPDLIAVVEGGVEETDLLLDKKFDLIFFTGSTPVGKIVLQKAAAQLTPTVLELGGKSPAVVLADADIPVAAKRLTWGKFMNAGQTCVAPDYILVHRSKKDELVGELKKTIQEFYGTNIAENPDYCRIINAKNFDRLVALFAGSQILAGGKFDRDALFIEPTLLSTDASAPIMQNEIFGPLLPLIEFSDLRETIDFIRARPKPLALYAFGRDQAAIDQILRDTSSGGVCINDVIVHMASPRLPFGGVGASGMGHYHGRYSFETFTHAKSVLRKATWLDVPVRYAPYTAGKLKWMKRLLK